MLLRNTQEGEKQRVMQMHVMRMYCTIHMGRGVLHATATDGHAYAIDFVNSTIPVDECCSISGFTLW